MFLANVFKRNAFSKHFTKTSIVAPLLSWSEQTLSCQQRFKCISVQVNYYLTNICPHWWILDECISLFCSVVFIIVEYLFLMQICFVMLIIVFFGCIFIVPLLCFLVVAVNLFIIFSAYLFFLLTFNFFGAYLFWCIFIILVHIYHFLLHIYYFWCIFIIFGAHSS